MLEMVWSIGNGGESIQSIGRDCTVLLEIGRCRNFCLINSTFGGKVKGYRGDYYYSYYLELVMIEKSLSHSECLVLSLLHPRTLIKVNQDMKRKKKKKEVINNFNPLPPFHMIYLLY